MKNYAPWEKKKRPKSITPLRQALTMGLAYAPVGLLVGGVVSITAQGTDEGDFVLMTAQGTGWEWFWICAGLAAFVAGMALWLAFVAAKPSTVRGLVAGALAGLVSHWLCWLFAIFFWRFGFLLMLLPASSLGQPPMTFLEAPFGAAILSFWSLFLFGAVTIPAGALIGGILGFVQKKSMHGVQSASTEVEKR